MGRFIFCACPFYLYSMLKIAAVQFDIQWEDAKSNRRLIEQLIKTQSDCDVIILPEMFTSGFSTNVAIIAEDIDGPSIYWMQKLAKDYDCAICGSISTKLNTKFVNRFYWVDHQGVQYYDKKHLFGYGKESDVYSPGTNHTLIEYKGWKILPLICYDLRFPVWSRNTMDYDLLLYVANWPDTRANAWRILLKARAIENLCYVCGVNRVGVDGVGLKYIGDTAIIDYKGDELASLKDEQGVLTASIEKMEMLNFRAKFNFLNDKDEFTLD